MSARRAIVVDDSRSMRKLMRMYLEDFGFEVIEAANGREALESMTGPVPLDLAVLDWNMPVMTGFELLTVLRADERFRSMPLLMVTTEGSQAQRLRALEAGATEYLAKPVSDTEWSEAMRSMGFSRAH